VGLTWLVLYAGALLLYFGVAGLDYWVVFVRMKARLLPNYKPDYSEMRREMGMSVLSLSIMAVMTVPFEVLTQLGYSKVYHNVADYPLWYLIASPLFFAVFSDSLIYFIHRGLHHPLIYKHIHKPHHSFIQTTPFSAFAFHPVDGFSQGFPYQLFPFLFPFHATVHLISLAVVSMWTINIHDRVSFHLPLINGAAHHTIHHTTFRSNYGQYFTVWDRICGTYKDPLVEANRKSLREDEAYDKKDL